MLNTIKIEDVFAEPSLTTLRRMPAQLIHRDDREGKLYVVFVKRDAKNELTEVLVAMTNGIKSTSDILARLFFKFENGFSFGYNCEEANLNGAELQMEREGKLHLHMVERLVATQLLRSDFAMRLQSDEQAPAAAQAH